MVIHTHGEKSGGGPVESYASQTMSSDEERLAGSADDGLTPHMSMMDKVKHLSPKNILKTSAWVGIGSILDMRGEATYQNLRALTPANRPKTSVKASFSTAMKRQPR
jgi:hypothetical protein